jgi:UDP-N-acetylglucosamine 4,6-dehydratase
MGIDQVKYTGIRPGEKLNEALISADEGRTTVDMGDHFRIYPTVGSVAKQMPEYWSYTSDNNPHWLTVDEIRETIQ